MFRCLHDEIDPNYVRSPWQESAELLYSGKAAMMIMGDWAKDERMQIGAVPGKDFLCVATPDSEGYFIYGIDSFAILQQGGCSVKHCVDCGEGVITFEPLPLRT